MERGRLALRLVRRTALSMLYIGGVLFLSAGTWRYWEGWFYLGALLAPTLVTGLYFLARDPVFLERRMRWRERDTQQRANRAAMGVLVVAGRVLAGVDHRYGWSEVPLALVLTAGAAIVGAFVL